MHRFDLILKATGLTTEESEAGWDTRAPVCFPAILDLLESDVFIQSEAKRYQFILSSHLHPHLIWYLPACD